MLFSTCFLLTLPRPYHLGNKGLVKARKLSPREESSSPGARLAGSREQTLCHLLLTRAVCSHTPCMQLLQVRLRYSPTNTSEMTITPEGIIPASSVNFFPAPPSSGHGRGPQRLRGTEPARAHGPPQRRPSCMGDTDTSHTNCIVHFLRTYFPTDLYVVLISVMLSGEREPCDMYQGRTLGNHRVIVRAQWTGAAGPVWRLAKSNYA